LNFITGLCVCNNNKHLKMECRKNGDEIVSAFTFILQALRLFLHHELTMKTKKTSEAVIPDLSLEFCTECNKALDNFAFSAKSKSKKKVQANFSDCKQKGKFRGELCSKVFISEDEIFLKPSEED